MQITFFGNNSCNFYGNRNTGNMPHQTWIKETLKAKGFKLKDMATALGITAPRVTDILRGQREVQADELQPLADLLGMGLTALLKSLEAGEAQDAPEPVGNGLQVEGYLMGDGTLAPLDAAEAYRMVAVPPDASTRKGLRAFIMGDSSMGQEIRRGDIIITADPREHFYPMVPGALLLVDCGAKDVSERQALRQFVKGDSGENWLVPLPETPNPDYPSWRFDMLPASLSESTSGPASGLSGNADGSLPAGASLRTDHVRGAVMWVHRRYNRAEPA